MKGKITREELDQSLITDVENINLQLDSIENKVAGRINIHQYLFLVTDNDWTLAIQTANDNAKDGEEIYFPIMKTNYIVNDTILKKYGVNWSGESERTVIEFKSDNKTLIIANEHENENTSFSSSTFKNLKFLGLGKTYNQIGLNLKGYKCRLENIEIRGFKKNLILSGVLIDFVKGTLAESDISLEIRKNDDNNVNGFSTMFNFESVDISKNNLGIKIKNYNGFTLVGFNLKSCIFGNNIKPFEFDDIKEGKISYCWFEGNSTKATLGRYRWVFENNHHHGENDKFNFSLNNNYNGITELNGSSFSTKKVTISKVYNNNVIEKSIEIDNDSNLSIDNKEIITTSGTNNKMYYILLSEKDSTDENLSSFTFSTNINTNKINVQKTSKGNYKIILMEHLRFATLNIDCFNCYKEANTPMYTVKLANTLDDADFRHYFVWNEININTKDSVTSENVNARLCITIFTNTDLS